MNLNRRCIHCVIFVAIWMACGWLFGLKAGAYLILGVPLVVAFQLLLNRRPVHQLWVQDAATFRLDGAGVLLVVALLGVPAYYLMGAISQSKWDYALLVMAALAGAPCAAFALRQQRADKLKQALPSFVAAVVIGCAIMVGMALIYKMSPVIALSSVPHLLGEFALMFPMCFLVEEVAFRGALDQHVVPAPEKPHHGWTLAIFVSAIWGLWHLPIQPIGNLREGLNLAGLDLGVHMAIGVPLSFCWRKSGTLVLPSAAHAFIDAYRNTIFP